jgi:arylsulfatase A-like enzyme
VLEARYAADVNRSLLRWVDRRGGDRPFFGFVNYVDAHSPYLPPAPFDSMFTAGRDPEQRSARYLAGMERAFGSGPVPAALVAEYIDGYDGALRYLDTEIDRLLANLDERGLLADTLVILTSDHGEHFGEHGLVQHGNSLFLPLLHVPLIVSWPGRVPAGLHIAAPTSLRHVAATILDLTEVPNPGLPGRSLAQRWGPDSAAFGADTLIASVDWYPTLTRFPPSPLLAGSLRAVVIDSLELVRRADGVEALYHLDRDFLQVRNLARDSSYRPALAMMRSALTAQIGSDPGPRPPPP